MGHRDPRPNWWPALCLAALVAAGCDSQAAGHGRPAADAVPLGSADQAGAGGTTPPAGPPSVADQICAALSRPTLSALVGSDITMCVPQFGANAVLFQDGGVQVMQVDVEGYPTDVESAAAFDAILTAGQTVIRMGDEALWDPRSRDLNVRSGSMIAHIKIYLPVPAPQALATAEEAFREVLG